MKVEISVADTRTSVKVDGEEIAGKIAGYSLSQEACGRPILMLTFEPDETEISIGRT